MIPHGTEITRIGLWYAVGSIPGAVLRPVRLVQRNSLSVSPLISGKFGLEETTWSPNLISQRHICLHWVWVGGQEDEPRYRDDLRGL